MEPFRILSEGKQFDLTIERLCYQLIEDHDDNFENTCIIGIQTGGVLLATRLQEKLRSILRGGKNLPFGKLDITFYRDDFRTAKKPLAANINDMQFVVENQRVILVDDVLYTGRSVQAAMTALNHYGRPHAVKLLVLVDRRFNRQIPIHADYTGISVDALHDDYVRVEWQQVEGNDRILLLPK
jgi:pyrimidine operon attenuation protein / uracil phosphoribosyltransferase